MNEKYGIYVKETGNITYGSKSYVLLCYAKMRGKKWFTRDDYKKFHQQKPKMIDKLSARLDLLVKNKFLEMLVDKDTEYFRITDAGSKALVLMAMKQAELEKLRSAEIGKMGHEAKARKSSR